MKRTEKSELSLNRDSRPVTSDKTQKRPIIFDGAKGTMLLPYCKNGELPCELNIRNSEIVKRLHRQYLEVGTDYILTNTVGLEILCNLNRKEKAYEIFQEGVRIADEIASEYNRHYSILISAPFIQPNISPAEIEELVQFYGRLFSLIEKDSFIVLETISSLSSLSILLEAIQKARLNSPSLIFSFIPQVIHLLKEKAQITEINRRIEQARIMDYITGINCGMSVEEASSNLTSEIRYLSPSDSLSSPDPEKWAEEVASAVRTNQIKIAGGCCNTTPDHIQALLNRLK